MNKLNRTPLLWFFWLIWFSHSCLGKAESKISSISFDKDHQTKQIQQSKLNLSVSFYAYSARSKSSLVKIERWQPHPESEIQPDFVKIILFAKNTASEPMNFVLLVNGDFKVASYRWVEEQPQTLSLEQVLKEIPWSKQNLIGQVKVSNLLPGEMRKIQLKNFNLGAFASSYWSQTSDLWPWKFRIQILAKTEQGKKLALVQAILPMDPVD